MLFFHLIYGFIDALDLRLRLENRQWPKTASASVCLFFLFSKYLETANERPSDPYNNFTKSIGYHS